MIFIVSIINMDNWEQNLLAAHVVYFWSRKLSSWSFYKSIIINQTYGALQRPGDGAGHGHLYPPNSLSSPQSSSSSSRHHHHQRRHDQTYGALHCPGDGAGHDLSGWAPSRSPRCHCRCPPCQPTETPSDQETTKQSLPGNVENCTSRQGEQS